jgi:hypothetical protein
MSRSISELGRNVSSTSLHAESNYIVGDNLAPILFIFAIHAVSKSLDQKWEFETPDFRWYPELKMQNREDNYLEPSTSTKELCFRSSSPIMWTIQLYVRRAAGNSPTMQWKSQDHQGECSTHGVQHHDKQGDRSTPYATPIFPVSKSLVLKKKKGK